ncbi:MAG: portal protein [Candidatus Scalindua sp.]
MADHEKSQRSPDDVVEFLADAQKRFDRLRSEDQHNREQARINLKFVYELEEGQWSQDDRDQRKEDGRPCLTSGQLRKFVAGVANAERDQRMAGNVRPVDSVGDPDTAHIIAGLIRSIEKNSNAEEVYTNAGEQAIAGNVGYWRIKSEELDDSFDQELFLVKITNQFSVTLDPDRMFGFIEEKITKDEFKHRHPNADEENIDPDSITDYKNWYDGDSLYIREYFYKERVKTTIVQATRVLDDSGQLPAESRMFNLGKDISEEEFKAQGWVIDIDDDGKEIKKTPKMFVVKWAKITGSQILEKGEWPGKDIPIIEVEGDWVWLDGKLYKRNLTQGAHDDQRMYNFWITSLAERYALSSKTPWMVTVKMVEGLEKWWDFVHKKVFAYLPFKGDKNMPGGPTRVLPPQISSGETAMLGIHRDNVMNTIGRFEASFGQKSNERSKVAIDARANRSEFSTFHFPDNFRRAVLESTRMLIDVIPHFIDTQRAMRVIGDDGKESTVILNYEIDDLDRDGNKIILNDLSVGKYDVVADVKLMSTRRQEQLTGMQALVAGNPLLGVLLAGDIAKLQDWDGAQELAAKIDANLPALLGIKPQEAEGQPEA